MSAAELIHTGAGVLIAPWAVEIIEVSALRNGIPALERLADNRGDRLPAPGQVLIAPPHLSLCVRPGRWLFVAPAPASGVAPGAGAARWQEACQDHAAAIDISCGLSAFIMAGTALREMLARGCRLDLDPGRFAAGRAAATIMAQVSVILAALPRGLLLLTPSSTAQHLHEWLRMAARPFGLRRELSIEELFLSTQ